MNHDGLGIDTDSFLDAKLGLPDFEQNIRLKRRGTLTQAIGCDVANPGDAGEDAIWPAGHDVSSGKAEARSE
jgi:hypothetical protein